MGDDVTIRCHVSGMGQIALIYWYKQQGDASLKLATNNIPEDGVEIEKYQYDVEEGEEDDIYFFLNIRGQLHMHSIM